MRHGLTRSAPAAPDRGPMSVVGDRPVDMQDESFRPGVAFKATAVSGAIVVGLLVIGTLFCAGWGIAYLVMH